MPGSTDDHILSVSSKHACTKASRETQELGKEEEEDNHEWIKFCGSSVVFCRPEENEFKQIHPSNPKEEETFVETIMQEKTYKGVTWSNPKERDPNPFKPAHTYIELID